MRLPLSPSLRAFHARGGMRYDAESAVALPVAELIAIRQFP